MASHDDPAPDPLLWGVGKSTLALQWELAGATGQTYGESGGMGVKARRAEILSYEVAKGTQGLELMGQQRYGYRTVTDESGCPRPTMTGARCASATSWTCRESARVRHRDRPDRGPVHDAPRRHRAADRRGLRRRDRRTHARGRRGPHARRPAAGLGGGLPPAVRRRGRRRGPDAAQDQVLAPAADPAPGDGDGPDAGRAALQVPFREKGRWKVIPNNPRRSDGMIHEYCPPEQVQSEMDRFIDLHRGIEASRYPVEAEAAWMHHRFVRTHPFRDGNGQVSRMLMAYAYLRRGLPQP